MSQQSRRQLLIRTSDVSKQKFGRHSFVVFLAFILSAIGPAATASAQDTDTQRPLPLPTNDLPDFSQQMELLRKLQSVVRSREQQKERQQERQSSEQKPSERQPSQEEPPEGPSSNAQKPSSDAGQMSQLQNALKNLSERLPPDFVPPSLDSIPKEDLRKAMENPAIRKSVQDLLRQFARDGVIPPPAPPGQQDSTRSPLPPQDPPAENPQENPEATNPQPEVDRSSNAPNADSKPDLKPDSSDDRAKQSKNSGSQSGEMPPQPDVHKPDSDSLQDGNSPESSNANTVPPSSLKSLQDFMNRLASQAPPRKSTEPDTNSESSNPNDSSNQPAPNRRNGPMRRRDPGTNLDRQTPTSPQGNPTDPAEPRGRETERQTQPETGAEDNRRPSSGLPSQPQPQAESNGATAPGSGAGSNPEAQRRALEALQKIMEEIQQEEAANAESSGRTDETTPNGGELNAGDRSKAMEMLRRFGPQNRSDSPDLADQTPPGNSRTRSSPADNTRDDASEGTQNSSAVNGDDPEFNMPSVQQFLKQELERMKSLSDNGDSSQNAPSRGVRNANSPADRLEQPSREPQSGPSTSRNDRNSSGPNPSIPPVRDSAVPLSSRPGMTPTQPPLGKTRGDSSMPGDPRSGRMGATPPDPADSSPRSSRSPYAPGTGLNARSAENIRKELEQRGVLETLKKTWEKSVQESREQRQQEIQQKQMQADSGAKSGSRSPTDPENRMLDLDKQLNELAQSIRDNPNTEKAAADMIERIANDMSEQQRSRSANSGGSAPTNSAGSRIAEKLNSEFPGKSVLRSIRDTVSEAISDTRSAAAGPSASNSGGGMLSGATDAGGSFDFTPVLFLAGALAAIAILFYSLRAVRFRQTPESALAGMVLNIRPSEISTRADIVRAFHEMAVRTARSAQLWWTHRKVQNALTTVAPEKQQAVETLVETYEQARYLPQELELSPDQIQSARAALQQLQT